MVKFYVYYLIDPRDGVVFYVGKGQGRRMYKHSPGSGNTVLGNKIMEILRAGLKIEYKQIFFTNDEQKALDYEDEVIVQIGLENLCNIISGGGGYSHSVEVKELISRSLIGNDYGKGNKGQIPWNKGKIGCFSKEALHKMSESPKHKIVFTDEVIRKMSRARKKYYANR